MFLLRQPYLIGVNHTFFAVREAGASPPSSLPSGEGWWERPARGLSGSSLYLRLYRRRRQRAFVPPKQLTFVLSLFQGTAGRLGTTVLRATSLVCTTSAEIRIHPRPPRALSIRECAPNEIVIVTALRSTR